MAGRIPMVGDPTPLDSDERKEDLKKSILGMRTDCARLLTEAKTNGNKSDIDEASKSLKKVQKLIDDYGLDSD